MMKNIISFEPLDFLVFKLDSKRACMLQGVDFNADVKALMAKMVKNKNPIFLKWALGPLQFFKTLILRGLV